MMVSERFARLSTGMKMLLILSVALLPLGLIALSASLQSARLNVSDREVDARLVAVSRARDLSAQLARSTATLRRAVDLLAVAPRDKATCRNVLGNLARAQNIPTRYAAFDNSGDGICSTPGFSALPAALPTSESGVDARLLERARTLRLDVADRGAGIVAAAELPEPSLARIVQPDDAAGSYGIVLRQGDADITISRVQGRSPLGQFVTASAPAANGQIALELTVNATRTRAIEVLMLLLPLLMWAAAAGIGWAVVDRLLLRPLAQVQKAIVGYEVGSGQLAIPPMTTPAHEIRSLGEAFRTVTERLASHDAEIEASLSRQTLLTREVHHRVKNNLQVVASLINLHARGARSEDAAAAYASIQRRVDALAVVHRNHYAELEENRGVGLRALIGELTANLRATAAPGAAGLAITLDLAPFFVTQDVAVSVAFLVTEIVEMAMVCGSDNSVAVGLGASDQPRRARLSITAPSLAGDACRSHPTYDRFNRVVEGLSRQLRGKLARNVDTGEFAIDLAVAEPLGEET